MVTILSGEEELLTEGLLLVVQEISNSIITGKQYFTSDEVVDLIIKHVGEETWEYRKYQGVQPV